MKNVLLYGLILLLIVACAIGLAFERKGLGWLPSVDSLALHGPLAALEQADGGLLILDKGGYRLLRLDQNQVLRWTSETSGLYGRIIALESDHDAKSYAIDQIADNDPAWRFERLVRIGPDGKPAGIILQKRVSGNHGFVPGALAYADGSLWYLFSDEQGQVSLYALNLAGKQERLIFKTEWSLPQAALAVSADGQKTYINAGGGLLRFEKGRFELLSEYRSALPGISFVRYDPEGKLLVADEGQAVLAELQAGGAVAVRLRQSNASFGKLVSPRPVSSRTAYFLDERAGLALLEENAAPASGMDFFSLAKDGFITVDTYNNRVAKFSAQGVAGTVLEAVPFNAGLVFRTRMAWLLLAGLVFLVLLLLVLVLLKLILQAPPVLAMVLACLPPAALMVLVLLLSLLFAGVESVQSGKQQILAELKGVVKTIPQVVEPQILKRRSEPPAGHSGIASTADLDRIVSGFIDSSDFGKVGQLCLYAHTDAGFVLLADSTGQQALGSPYRQLGPGQAAALAAGRVWTGIQRRPSRLTTQRANLRSTEYVQPDYSLQYAAAQPLIGTDGTLYGLAVLSLPALRPGVISVFRQSLGNNGLQLWMLVIAGALLLLSIALFSALRLAGSERHGREILPDEDSLKAPTERGAVQLPLDADLEGNAGDDDLNMLFDETHFDPPGLADHGTLLPEMPELPELPELSEFSELTELTEVMDVSGLTGSTQLSGPDRLSPDPSPPRRLDDRSDPVSETEPYQPTPAGRPGTPAPEAQEAPSNARVLDSSHFKPEDHTRQHQAAISALKRGDNDQAVVLLEQLLETFPSDTRAWNNLGIAYKRQGRLLMAVRSLEKSLALDPNNNEARKNLAKLKQL